MALLPLWGLPSWPAAGDAQVRLAIIDIPLAALAALWVPWLCRWVERRVERRALGSGLPAAAVSALVGLLLVALITHPSRWGLLGVVRVCGVIALFLTLRAATGRPRLKVLVGLLLVAGCAETFIAVAQLAYGHPVGLRALGELSDHLTRIGPSLAPRGTFQHRNALAGFALVVTFTGLALLPRVGRRSIVACALALSAFPLGLTYSRAGLLGLAAGLVTMLAARRRDRETRLAVAAIVAGVLAAALLGPGGWQARLRDGSSAASAGDLDRLATDRVSMTRRALDVVADHPVVGVGLGNYLPGSEFSDRANPRISDEIVHNLPLFVAVEAGIPAGLAMLVLVVAFGLRAARDSLAALSVYLAFLPFLLLDRFAYDGPQGMAMTAVWLAAVELAVRVEHNRGASPAWP